MSSDNVLTQAAQRAHDAYFEGDFPAEGTAEHQLWLNVAKAVLTPPRRGYGEAVCRRCDVQAAFCPCEKPDVSTHDRDALARLIDDELNAVHNANSAPDAEGDDLRSEGEIIADRLISAALVRTLVTAEQIEKAAQAAFRHSVPSDPNDTWDSLQVWDKDDYREMTKAVVLALGLSVAERGDHVD